MTAIHRFTTVLLFMFSATAAQAVTTYQCELTAHTRFGFIPPVVLIAMEDDNSAAQVYDGFIKKYVGKPLRAKLEQTGPHKFSLSWDVDNVRSGSNTRLKTQNILRLDIGRMRATFVGYVGGVANTNRGSGKCKVVKNE